MSYNILLDKFNIYNKNLIDDNFESIIFKPSDYKYNDDLMINNLTNSKYNNYYDSDSDSHSDS